MALKFAKSVQNRRFVVNYEDKSTLEVYKDFLHFCISRSKSLDLLCFPWAATPTDSMPPLPSWICLLSNRPFEIDGSNSYCRINADPLVGRPGIMKPYSAAKTQPAIWKFADDHGSVEVKGFKLATLGKISTDKTREFIPFEWFKEAGWTDHSEEPPGSFWRTLVANRTLTGQKSPRLWSLICQKACNRRPKSGDFNITQTLGSKCSTATKTFLERVKSVIYRRHLILLDGLPSRTIGLSSEGTQIGDVVCILYGCSVPVLLRKYVNNLPVSLQTSQLANKDTEQAVHYKIVGDVYVHGYMDGEAIDTLMSISRPRREEEMFLLR